MSKPAGKCVFCGGPGLTKGHIWPEWVQNILPPNATHHEQIVGRMHTFVPKVAGPALWQKIKQGPVASRKPRNTCKKCNSEWMSEIENAVKPATTALVLGYGGLLSTLHQRLLASFLCLVAMRVELGNYSKLRAIPQSDRDLLRQTFQPSLNWKIWIAHYEGSPTEDHRQLTMQIVSSPTDVVGPEHCNTQVTTLVVGQLHAHLFNSTVWDDFPGYEGAVLCQIWPPTQFDIDLRELPVITEAEVPWLHETIARDSKVPEWL